MISLLSFVKLHGLGNDFVLFDGLSAELPAWLDEPSVVARLCDRHFGIGADGLLLVGPSVGGAVARMRVLNADGSEPEMCGNGLRCVAAYLLAEGHVTGQPAFGVETGAGVLTCAQEAGRGPGAARFVVDMGRPSLAPNDLPMRVSAPHIDAPLQCEGRTFVGTAISIGNPHFVVFVPERDVGLEELARGHGPSLEHHALFPQRVNVEFARVLGPQAIEVWVWERGAGLTLACGTGACAVAVAATVTGRVSGPRVDITLPGGDLAVEVDPQLRGVRMFGPAVEVYRGALPVTPTGPG